MRTDEGSSVEVDVDSFLFCFSFDFKEKVHYKNFMPFSKAKRFQSPQHFTTKYRINHISVQPLHLMTCCAKKK